MGESIVKYERTTSCLLFAPDGGPDDGEMRKRDISLFVDLPVYLYVIKAESREILISSPDWPSDGVCGMRCPNKGLYGPTTTSPRLRPTTAQNQRQSFPFLLLFLTNPSLGRSEGFLYACSWALIIGSLFTCLCQCSPACIHPRSSERGWKERSRKKELPYSVPNCGSTLESRHACPRIE